MSNLSTILSLPWPLSALHPAHACYLHCQNPCWLAPHWADIPFHVAISHLLFCTRRSVVAPDGPQFLHCSLVMTSSKGVDFPTWSVVQKKSPQTSSCKAKFSMTAFKIAFYSVLTKQKSHRAIVRQFDCCLLCWLGYYLILTLSNLLVCIWLLLCICSETL